MNLIRELVGIKTKTKKPQTPTQYRNRSSHVLELCLTTYGAKGAGHSP